MKLFLLGFITMAGIWVSAENGPNASGVIGVIMAVATVVIAIRIGTEE